VPSLTCVMTWFIFQEGYSSKLLFKKRMFRETDETITEPQFVNLSYVQVSLRSAICCPSPSFHQPFVGNAGNSDALLSFLLSCPKYMPLP
jgi:hypothetical protein